MNINQIKTTLNLVSWITYALVILGCILLGLLLRWILFSFLKFSNRRKPTVLKAGLLKHLKTPAKFFLPILFIYSSFSFLELNTFWHKVIESLIIINFSWIIIASLNAVEEVVKQKFNVSSNHKAKDRKVLT